MEQTSNWNEMNVWTESIENREALLNEKLLSFELKYCAELWEKKIPFPDNSHESASFEEIINNYSDISADIHSLYESRTGKVPEGGDVEFEAIENEILSAIHQAYDISHETWTSQVPGIIRKVINILSENNEGDKKIYTAEHHQGFNIENPKAGLLEYEVRNNFSKLEEYGISKDDQCVIIHLDALYKQSHKNDEMINIFSSDSFRKLAEKIAADYPETKAIVAESWIMDSPIGKRAGFHVFPSQFENFYHGDAFWGQFYDQHGELNKERMAQFLETGKAPFTVKGGYFLKDEFLEKYLPKE